VPAHPQGVAVLAYHVAQCGDDVAILWDVHRLSRGDIAEQREPIRLTARGRLDARGTAQLDQHVTELGGSVAQREFEGRIGQGAVQQR